MKTYVFSLILTMLCVEILLVTACSHQCLADTNPGGLHSNFDNRFEAITPARLSAELAANSNSTSGLFGLVERAEFHNEGLAAYLDLKTLAKEQPNNANILAAYCFASGAASGDFAFNMHASAFENLTYSADMSEYQTDLAKAATLDPRNWLVNIINANHLQFYKSDKPASLALLRAAVAEAPDVSYVHSELAEGLCQVSAHNTYPNRSDYTEAAIECEKATKLQPVDATAEGVLLWIYSYGILDPEKAREAKAAYLSELPPDYTPPAYEQPLLAKIK